MKNPKKNQYGFAIIEALISLVIMGFGIFSLMGMHNGISRSADDARQRTEAVRLAQEKIESFRSLTGISATTTSPGVNSTTALNWNAFANGNDSVTTNTTYARTWSWDGTTSDPMRNLKVSVAWADRTGNQQTIVLSSIISKSDPADSGFLGFPLPLNTPLKRPKNRNLDIPIPAIDLNNGESAVKFGASDQYVLFGNVNGDLVKICNPTLASNPSTATVIAALTSTTLSNCINIKGFILAGYVARYVGSSDSSLNIDPVSSTNWTAIKDSLAIDYSGITRNAAGSTAISCQFGDAVNQNTGALIANYKYYMCVIPLTEPSTTLTTNGPYNWSGTIKIAGPTVWNSANNLYYVCRYQYSNSQLDNNQKNIQPYTSVNESIDQQNYLIVTSRNNSSSNTPSCPPEMTVSGVSTGVLHQDCRSASNAGYASACPRLATYTVTYNGNGNTGGAPPTDSASPYASGATVITKAAGTLVKSGGTFTGWNTAADGSGLFFAVGDSFVIGANTTLYAAWN